MSHAHTLTRSHAHTRTHANLVIRVLIWLSLTAGHTTINAQEQFVCELPPELELELQDPPPPSNNQCFDKGYVLNNCIPIYLKVNVHFILDDNCGGALAAAPYVQEDLDLQMPLS